LFKNSQQRKKNHHQQSILRQFRRQWRAGAAGAQQNFTAGAKEEAKITINYMFGVLAGKMMACNK
jgi:hypothetical protein